MFITDCLAYKQIKSSVSKLPSVDSQVVSITFEQNESDDLLSLSLSYKQAEELALQLFSYLLKTKEDDPYASNIIPVPRWLSNTDQSLPESVSA